MRAWRQHPVDRVRQRALAAVRQTIGPALVALALLFPYTARADLGAPVVFCRLPVDRAPQGPQAGGMLRADYGEGAQLVELLPNGTTRLVVPDFAASCEADVSFDGERILFAGKRQETDPWGIWELELGGGTARRVAQLERDCRAPVYLSTLYTITSSEPWYTVLFVCDDGVVNEAGLAPATSLYSVRLDGSELRRITFSPGNDFDPVLMRDGRLVFAGWRFRPTTERPMGRVGLFGVFSDGIDYAAYGARQGATIQHMPAATTEGTVVFVEAEEVAWDGAGRLAAVSAERPHHTYRRLTREEEGLFHSPSPLPDGSLLVSRRPTDGSATHALYRYHPRSGDRELLFDDPASHELHARSLASRPEPDGRSSTVRPESPTGKLYALDIRWTDPARAGALDPSQIPRIRVLEGVPVAAAAGGGEQVEAGPPGLGTRLLGEAPVEADGSFHIDLPADLPVRIQLVDRDGLAVESCDWIWVKQREYRGCIGCHEDPELTPENRFVDAAKRSANQLTLPPERRRSPNFRDDIQPLLEERCVSCHGESGSPPLLAGDPLRIYATLTAPAESDAGGQPGRGRFIDPGRARTSSLVWLLFGRDTSRPWDPRPTPSRQLPDEHTELLEDLERRLVVEWIDLGARWQAPPVADTAEIEGAAR